MPQPTPHPRHRRRRAAVVFLPPIALFALGFWLFSQGQSGEPGSPTSSGTDSQSQASSSSSTVDPDASEQRIDALRPLIDDPSSELYVVNKTRPFEPIEYEPENLVVIPSGEALDNSRGLQLVAPAASALAELAAAMREAGFEPLFINSAYRSYQTQVDLFQAKIEQYGKEKALVHSAKPGHSEHQSGLAVDVSELGGSCAILACFGQTEAGKWLAENGWKYGFIIRYPDGWQPTTGYTYEPWHLRYLGVEVATLYRESRKGTLEDFWGLPPAPDYLG